MQRRLALGDFEGAWCIYLPAFSSCIEFLDWVSLHENKGFGWLHALRVSCYSWIHAAPLNRFDYLTIIYCHSAPPFILQPSYATLVGIENPARKVLMPSEIHLNILSVISLFVSCFSFLLPMHWTVYLFLNLKQLIVFILAVRFPGRCHIRMLQAQFRANSHNWQRWPTCESDMLTNT